MVVAGDHGEELLENGRLAHSSSLDEPQMIIGFGRLWWRGLRGSKEPFNVAILFSMPLVCVYCLNVLGVYPGFRTGSPVSERKSPNRGDGVRSCFDAGAVQTIFAADAGGGLKDCMG